MEEWTPTILLSSYSYLIIMLFASVLFMTVLHHRYPSVRVTGHPCSASVCHVYFFPFSRLSSARVSRRRTRLNLPFVSSSLTSVVPQTMPRTYFGACFLPHNPGSLCNLQRLRSNIVFSVESMGWRWWRHAFPSVLFQYSLNTPWPVIPRMKWKLAHPLALQEYLRFTLGNIVLVHAPLFSAIRRTCHVFGVTKLHAFRQWSKMSRSSSVCMYSIHICNFEKHIVSFY